VLVAVLLLLAFGVLLTIVAAHRRPFTLDSWVLQLLERHRSGPVDAFAETVSTVLSPIGVQLLVAVTVLAVAVGRHSLRPVLLGALCIGGAQFLSSATKSLVDRPRPPMTAWVPHVTARGMAFPSGHATAAATGFTLIAALLSHRISSAAGRGSVVVVAAAMILLVGWSRVYLGVHWPTDVAGGWLLGVGWTLGSLAILDCGLGRQRANRAAPAPFNFGSRLGASRRRKFSQQITPVASAPAPPGAHQERATTR
jgi:membrane-associated phospholipid phosphatase